VENYEKECFLESVSLFLSLFLRMQKQTFRNLQENPKGKPLHIQKKSNRLSNESSIPLSRWREVHEKFTRFFFSFTFFDF